LKFYPQNDNYLVKALPKLPQVAHCTKNFPRKSQIVVHVMDGLTGSPLGSLIHFITSGIEYPVYAEHTMKLAQEWSNP
jgi:hypothetical protein